MKSGSQRTRRNILVSSAAAKIPLIQSVIAAARRLHPDIRVLAADLAPHALSRFVAHGFICLPRTLDANVEEIRDLCVAHGVGTVVPTRDGELEFWAAHAPLFKQSAIEIVVSAADAVAICVDKLRFAAHGEIKKLPILPAWMQPQGAGPFVVKERFGAGSRSIGLNLDPSAARSHAKSLTHAIFQPFIEGTEISVDAWLDPQHRLKGLVMRTRDRVVNGESVVTTTFRDADLEAVCRRVLESLPLQGPVVLQLIRDAQGTAHILELNARFGGASTTAIAAGLDSWFWSLLTAEGSSTEDFPFRRIASEVRQIRVTHDLHFYDSHF